MRRLGLLLYLLLVVGVVFPASAARADDVDEAALLPTQEAIEALQVLLTNTVADESVGGAARQARTFKIRERLARLRLDQGEPYAALAHLEVLAHQRGEALDHVAYAEALLQVARRNLARSTTAAGVVPYLKDALSAVSGLVREKMDAVGWARRALAAAEAQFLLHDSEGALETLAGLGLSAEAPAYSQALHHLRARALYVLGRYERAAASFAAAGQPLGAAAAWDAARKPGKSLPIYVAAIKRAPADPVLLERALAGARYTGAELGLLEELLKVPVPPQGAGVPLLLATADLQEAVGRLPEALAPLREAVLRSGTDPTPAVRLGRVLLLTGDVENEDTWDEAANAYMDAIKKAPEDEGALAGLMYIAQRDYGRLWTRWRDTRSSERCRRVQEAMAKARPDDSLVLSNLANTLRVLGSHGEALTVYARALEAAPFDPSIRSDQGLALAANGESKEALAAFRASVALDSGHLAGRQNAARSHWQRGEDDAADLQLGAAVRTARAVGQNPTTYRFLLDRQWRTRRDPRLR